MPLVRDLGGCFVACFLATLLLAEEGASILSSALQPNYKRGAGFLGPPGQGLMMRPRLFGARKLEPCSSPPWQHRGTQEAKITPGVTLERKLPEQPCPMPTVGRENQKGSGERSDPLRLWEARSLEAAAPSEGAKNETQGCGVGRGALHLGACGHSTASGAAGWEKGLGRGGEGRPALAGPQRGATRFGCTTHGSAAAAPPPRRTHLLGADVAFHVLAPAGLGQRQEEQQQRRQGGEAPQRRRGQQLHPQPHGRLQQPGSAPCALSFKETRSQPPAPSLPLRNPAHRALRALGGTGRAPHRGA